MSAGLSTPLHLAANLLALFAAAGLAIVVASHLGVGPSGAARRHRLRWLAVAGACALAAGHGLAGALVEPAADAIPWLLAGGLVLLAVGLAPKQLGLLATPSSGSPVLRAGGLSALVPAVIVPAAPVAAGAIGAAAGGAAALRALLGGRQTAMLGIGLLAWGGARGISAQTASAAAWLTILGALAIAIWLWQASARQLRARLVTAFVVTLLGVVVLLAVVLSTLGSTSIVEDELRNLGATSGDLSQAVAQEWPRDAIERARLLAGVGQTVELLVAQSDTAGLERVLQGVATAQDFIAILDPDGRVLLNAARVDALDEGSFLLALSGDDAVDRLTAGQRESGGLLTVGGQVVAVGGVAVFVGDDPRPEDSADYLVVAGRIADDLWASQAASQLPMELAVVVGDELSAASGDVAGVSPRDVVDALPSGVEAATVSVGGRELFAAAAPIVEPTSLDELGQIVAVRSGEVLAQVERDQARQLFVIALIGGLLAGLVTAAVSGRLVAPIRDLTQVAAAVREGDLDAQADVRTPDEVGELGRTFNEMTASLSVQSAQLRESAEVQGRLRARLEALNASMSDALVAVDGAGDVITFNPAAERLVGRPAAEVLGRPLGEVLQGQAPGDEAVTTALGSPRSERVAAVQLLLAGASGRYTPTAVTAAPVRDGDGSVLGRVLVLRDVSREVEIERMKSEFLSNVSHELRTPLTPIKGYAEVLARRDVGAEATQRFAAQILESTSHLERIVGMIVDFAALDSRRMVPQIEPLDVSDLVGDVLARWRERAPDRTFNRRVARNLPPVMADRRMLERCLDELLDNAVKFSPGGEPVSITAQGEDGPDGPVVRLSVRDRGVGIELDTAANLFGDFYQADASETRLFGGLGLGLALVRRIVDALGGDAAVESELGAGATFHVLLDAADTKGDDPPDSDT